ncbi:uncharacterized protein LOC143431546 [Xylocopa sonorina]
MDVVRFIKRYWIVTFFPTVTIASIYADWNHTRLWKKQLAKEGKL